MHNEAMKKEKKDYQFSINSMREYAKDVKSWSALKSTYGFKDVATAKKFCKDFNVKVNVKKISYKHRPNL